MRRVKHLVILFFILVPFIGFSQELITDRPDQTESAVTVEKGFLQIETGAVIEYLDNVSSADKNIIIPTTLFRYGLVNGFELRLVNQQVHNRNDEKLSGISDFELGAKIQIFKKESTSFEAAFLTHFIFPSGTINFSDNNAGVVNKLAISHALTQNSGLGYNIGYNYLGTGNGDLTYSLVLGVSVTDKTAFYIEPYGEIVDFQNAVMNFNAGVTYLIKSNLQFDFSFGTGVNESMNFISAGLSWKTGRL